MKTIAVSGGFDPLHIGHIRLFNEARALGDELVVILNNDNWLNRKKGFVMMGQEDRKEILEALDSVGRVIISNHEPNSEDYSVCNELSALLPSIFANGGDRFDSNIPEYQMCKKLNIHMMFNVGGDKIRSSCESFKPALNIEWVDKPWGRYKTIWEIHNKKLKILEIYPGQRTSLQYHNHRSETWTLISGKSIAKIDGTNYRFYQENQRIKIKQGSIHRLTNNGTRLTVIFEVQEGKCQENDIVRLEDDYGRLKNTHQS
jgi:D-beta-D-heptose 7-phosphate kinase/D-beta-D-heptose 1-phosphate adenosyltransferase